MKTKIGLMVASLAVAALAGNVCTWTGAGGDGKFSTAANWDVAPVSGNGDLLFFNLGGKDAVNPPLTAVNDIDGLSVAAIRTDGHNNSVLTLNGGGITLTGASTAVCPEIPATTVVSNWTSLVLNVPITVTRAGGDAYMRFYGQKLTVNAKLSASNVGKLFLHGRLDAAFSDYIGEVERYPSKAEGFHFNAPLEAPDTIVHERMGQNCGGGRVYFNAKVTAKEMCVGSDTRDSKAYFNVAGNDIGRISFNSDATYLNVAEAFGADTVICDTRSGYGWMWSGNYYIKSGTHQTINRIEGNGDYLVSFPNAYNLRTDGANSSAEVELRGSADASTCIRVCDKVSLTWNPTGDFKQTFRDRVSDTKGEITVKGGTFAVAGTNAFTGVPIVCVLPGAKLEIASTNADHPAFEALTSLLLGDGAECVAAAGSNPFSAGKVMAVLGTGAKFTVASGVDAKLAILTVNGTRIADGTYTAGTACPWLEGAGSVTVSQGGGTTGTTRWLLSGDGDWDVAANWSEGVPGAASTAVIMGNGDGTVRLTASSVLPAKLSVRNVNGATTVLMPEGERAWNPTELKLEAGGRIEVPTGAKLVSDDAAGTVLVKGGEICVSGGTMVYTNFHGSFTVQGTSVSTGRVFLANGTFQFSHKSMSDAYRLKVDSFGEIYATNGFFEAPAMDYPLNQTGGRIVIAGNTEFRNGESRKVEWAFGAGETIFDGDAVFHNYTTASRFHVVSYDANTPAKLVFRGNAYVTTKSGTQMEDPSIGSSGGARSILEIDSVKPNKVQFGYRLNVGTDDMDGELVVKRGFMFVGYRGLNLGGSQGNQWNAKSAKSGAHGVLRMLGGGMRVVDSSGNVSEGAFQGFRVADGGPACLARDLKGAFTGIAEVSGGVITNNGSTVIGGGRGIGTYTQTGGTFLHRYASAVFLAGCAGGTGSLTLGGGLMDVAGEVFVGGALTNQIPNGIGLGQYYDGNYPVDQHDAVGTLMFTGGTFRCAKNLFLGCDGTGTLATRGVEHDVTIAGNLVLSNTTVAANGDLPGWTTAAKLKFALDDAAGIVPVKVTGKVVNTAGTTVEVDLGHYKGKKAKFPLVTASAFDGASFANVEFTGDDAPAAKIVQGTTSLDLVIHHGMTLVFR